MANQAINDGRPAPFTTPISEPERKTLRRAIAFVKRNYRKRLRLADVAKVTGFSTFHFHRRFKLLFGETPQEVITRLRIEQAQRLMLKGEPLERVGRRLGFNSQSHFTMRFKRATGIPPGRWRRALQEGVPR